MPVPHPPRRKHYILRNFFSNRPLSPPSASKPLNLRMDYIRDALGSELSQDFETCCVVCATRFRKGQKILTLPCGANGGQGHVVHDRCGMGRVMETGKCGICGSWVVDEI
jgi:hypothetical protein